MAKSVDNFLAHYGVKGMKWGKRRAASNAPASGYSKYHQTQDLAAFGKGGPKRINRAMNKGKTRDEALKTERKIRNTKTATLVLGAAAVYYGPRIADAHQKNRFRLYTAMNTAQAAKGRKFSADLLASSRGIANYETIALTLDPVKDLWS